MKISLAEHNKNTVEYGLIYGSIIIFILGAVRVLEVVLDIPKVLSNFPCTFKTLTHIPCLTCGMTRSAINFVHLNVIDAFKMNPVICLTILILLVWGIWSLIRLIIKAKHIKIDLTSTERRIVILSVITLIVINWLYLILAGR
jgi:hypothetical protein